MQLLKVEFPRILQSLGTLQSQRFHLPTQTIFMQFHAYVRVCSLFVADSWSGSDVFCQYVSHASRHIVQTPNILFFWHTCIQPYTTCTQNNYIHTHTWFTENIYIYNICIHTSYRIYIYILYIYLHLHNPCFLSGLPLNPRSYHFGILNPGSSFKTPGFPKIQGPNQIKPLPRRCRIKDILTRATNMGYVWVPTYI